MKVQFLGATHTVTGSCFLLKQGETSVLVDCGMYQGFKELRLRNWADFPVPPSSIDAVVLTHAHLDHSGYLPRLVKSGFRGPIYASQATMDLCGILLPDSGFLQEEEARLANKAGFSKHQPAMPLYTAADAHEALKLFRAVPWRTPWTVEHSSVTGRSGSKIEFVFHPAGHLLGAASVIAKSASGEIAFSGDVGRISDPLIRRPDPQFSAENLVIESTYGNRSHAPTDPEQEIRQVVLRTFERGGTLLIPAFAVGRAQQVLFYLQQLRKRGEIPSIPIYLNSPMAAHSNRVFQEHVAELKISANELAEIWKDVTVIVTAEESQRLSEREEPSIIIAASGMATGGRVLHHLKALLPHRKNTVLFAGFQAGGTRGDALVRGAEKVKIHGAYWPVHAEILNLESLSAHADREGLVAWLKSLPRLPRRVMVVHGEPEATEALRKKIAEELGLEVCVPEHRQEFDLSRSS